MENKLIPMTTFVMEIENGTSLQGSKLKKIVAYAEFLKKPLALWMFVPCDEGNIIEYDLIQDKKCYGLNCTCFDKESNCDFKKWYKAKSRVLFEGFDINGAEIFNKALNISIYLDTYEYVEHHDNGYGGGNLTGINIEAIANAHLKITLTETAIKSIYES
ncbi:hypothetical protein [Elizabethkingia ursingii]|uniref:Uncharacterized protein n=1 Tax=Elizabethkingia ursingii TaxID=1756150 RepID=A0AAJ3TPS8_9FLAO|nr:hypothetical protein [Elizabethkingia ursingii]AQX09838.1 hypothetical protein BBD34_14875 [Elizabethkingia ursingii]OPB75981.1 hypothetical protein BAY32_04245 [Elizabethkingia ursingii]OPB84648.1 hypothetical protein BB021_14925 [Elizabethkingia ursingii]